MSTTFKGGFKAIEEMGECQQVLGKAGAFPEYPHPDGGPPLTARLEEEISDVFAALKYLVEENGLDKTKIMTRTEEKLKLFREWELTGFREEVK